MTESVEGAVIRKARRIPTKGEVLVKVGDLVESSTVVSRGFVRNLEVHEIKVYSKLGVGPDEVKKYMLKEEGDEVKKDEVIAMYRGFFGRLTGTCRSPIDGHLEIILRSGIVLIRGMPIPVEAKAHIPGRVVELIPGEGAVVETRATIVNGVFGIGGEAIGELVLAVNEPDEALTDDLITNMHKGKVVVGGSIITLDALRKAAIVGARGVLIGGVDQKDLTDFLGHEIGVGVTGREEAGPTVIVTEGFGVYPMDADTFKLLKSKEGKQASIDGTTQIRQRMLRPEIIIPL